MDNKAIPNCRDVNVMMSYHLEKCTTSMNEYGEKTILFAGQGGAVVMVPVGKDEPLNDSKLFSYHSLAKINI